jgi:hypothetical protein
LRASISISLCFPTSLSPSSSLLLIHKMQRSSNSSRVTEELFKNASTDTDQQELPTYDPLSHIGKKEKSRLRSAEYAIHVIPLLLVLCAIILWFFSNSPGTQVLSSFYFVTLPFVYFLKRYSDWLIALSTALFFNQSKHFYSIHVLTCIVMLSC